jgi:aspartate aminotransferase
LDVKALEQTLKRRQIKAIILNSPHNPTGGVFSKAELERIGELLLRHSVWIISDEIYEHYTYEIKHSSIASLDPQLHQRTLTVNGVSKTYAMTGWRIGYAGGPRDLVQAMARLQSHSTSCACSISQWASVAALQIPDSEVSAWMADFIHRRNSMLEGLGTIPHMRVGKTSGAFYVFPDFNYFLGATTPSGRVATSVDLAEYLLETAGVATVPGSAFGREGHLRLSYCVSQDDIRRGIERIQQALKDLRRSNR